jgi:hypothetical protein
MRIFVLIGLRIVTLIAGCDRKSRQSLRCSKTVSAYVAYELFDAANSKGLV